MKWKRTTRRRAGAKRTNERANGARACRQTTDTFMNGGACDASGERVLSSRRLRGRARESKAWLVHNGAMCERVSAHMRRASARATWCQRSWARSSFDQITFRLVMMWKMLIIPFKMSCFAGFFYLHISEVLANVEYSIIKLWMKRVLMRKTLINHLLTKSYLICTFLYV